MTDDPRKEALSEVIWNAYAEAGWSDTFEQGGTAGFIADSVISWMDEQGYVKPEQENVGKWGYRAGLRPSKLCPDKEKP